MFAELSVPGRNHHRDCALSLSLTSQTNQRLWFGSIDVTELLDLLSFAGGDVSQPISPAEHADPASTAGGRTAFDWNRSFHSSGIQSNPIARTIIGRAPGEVLPIVQFVFGFIVVFVMPNGELSVNCLEKAEQALTVDFGALAENLFGRLLCVLLIYADLAGCAPESSQSGLLHGHEGDRGDADEKRLIFPGLVSGLVRDFENLIRQRSGTDFSRW